MSAKLRVSLLLVCAIAATSIVVPRAGASPGDVSEWELASGTSPEGIATGPDGNIWIVERLGNAVVRFSPDGYVVDSIPLAGGPAAIARGGDGAMWVLERSGNRIARIAPDASVREWSVPGSSNGLFALARGSDGAIWFTERGANQIGRITMDGQITEFDVPTADAQPSAVTLGADGNLWFTQFSPPAVGRITPDGTFLRDISLPDSGRSPQGIAAGRAGAIWVVGTIGNGLLRIDPTTFAVTEELTTGLDGPAGIVRGPDRAMWIAERMGNRIGRFDLEHRDLSEFADPSNGAPANITVGPDLNIWFTASMSSTVGQVETDKSLSDLTAPTITIQIPEDGGTYVLGDVVAADYTCADEAGGSGLASCDGTVAEGESIDTASTGDHTFSVTATDNEGNSRTRLVTYEVLKPKPKDTTAPSITVSTPAADATYLVDDKVRADYACKDEDGGSGLVSCTGSVPNGEMVDTSSAGTHTFTVDAADASGNTSSASVTYTVEKPKPADTTAPTITIDVPQDGAAFMVGDRPLAEYACADAGGSGLSSCDGPVPNGDAIDTSKPGIFSFTVRASDGAGNRSSLTTAYVVFKEWGGKLELPPAMNEVASGSAVPIWFNLGDATTAVSKSATSPTSTPIDCTTHAPTGPTTPASVTPTGTRSSTGRVMYVWKTDRSWAGTCRAFTLGIVAPTTLYLHFS